MHDLALSLRAGSARTGDRLLLVEEAFIGTGSTGAVVVGQLAFGRFADLPRTRGKGGRREAAGTPCPAVRAFAETLPGKLEALP